MVPAVLKRRLRRGGRALLCCAVREQVRVALSMALVQPAWHWCASCWALSAFLHCMPRDALLTAFYGCTVPLQAMFDGFAAACRSALGLRVGITPVQPRADDAGLLVGWRGDGRP